MESFPAHLPKKHQVISANLQFVNLEADKTDVPPALSAARLQENPGHMGLFTNHWIGILGGFAVAISAAPAQAQEFVGTDGGIYWSVRGGLSQVRNGVAWDWGSIDPTYNAGPPITVATRGLNAHSEWRSLEMDYGYVIGTSIGYTFAYPDYAGDIRIELEGIYRRHDDGQINSDWRPTSDNADSDSLGFVTAPIDGTLDIRSAMFNVLMDFRTSTRLTPYLGMGAGISQLNAEGLVWDSNRGRYIVYPQPFDERIYALSWQAILGVGYRLTPGTMVTLDFRHFRLATDRWSDLFQTDELRDITFDDWSMGLRFTF